MKSQGASHGGFGWVRECPAALGCLAFRANGDLSVEPLGATIECCLGGRVVLFSDPAEVMDTDFERGGTQMGEVGNRLRAEVDFLEVDSGGRSG